MTKDKEQTQSQAQKATQSEGASDETLLACDQSLDDWPDSTENPMGTFGELLLKFHRTHPVRLWLMLMLGFQAPAWISIYLGLWVAELFEPVILSMGFTMPTIRTCIYLSWILFFLSTHALWRRMNQERKYRLLRGYLLHGSDKEYFQHNPRAMALRQRYMERKAKERQLRNRQSRARHRRKSDRERNSRRGRHRQGRADVRDHHHHHRTYVSSVGTVETGTDRYRETLSHSD